jgi:hypothetical protein
MICPRYPTGDAFFMLARTHHLTLDALEFFIYAILTPCCQTLLGHEKQHLVLLAVVACIGAAPEKIHQLPGIAGHAGFLQPPGTWACTAATWPKW